MTNPIQSFTFALAGNPNAGKTTLFNHLTGARQHVGNYPGITVERKEGYLNDNGRKITIVDLPGTYSLTAYSAEELVARDFLVNEKPEVVINIVDASNLERNLYLTTQFLELGVPLVIALNMVDVAKTRGITVQAEKLEEILGVPVVPIVARSGLGTRALLDAACRIAAGGNAWQPLDISYGDDLDATILRLVEVITTNRFLTVRYPARFTAIKYLENDEQILDRGRDESPAIAAELEADVARVSQHLQKTLNVFPEAIIADHRYGYLKAVLRDGVITHAFDVDRLYTSDKIDKIVTNRLLGPLIMIGILLGLYQFTFSWSEIPVVWMESFFGWLRSTVENLLAEGPLRSLLVSGIIDGVGGVLGFVPLILFMFFGIAVLEDSGYLARVAYMMDRVFRSFGLHGSSVMPFIVSGGIAGGCAVPGVMATRTLRSPKDGDPAHRAVHELRRQTAGPGAVDRRLLCRSPGADDVPVHHTRLAGRPLRREISPPDRAARRVDTIRHGTAAVSVPDPARPADPYLGTNLAVYQKSRHGDPGHLHPALGDDDIPRSTGCRSAEL
jgi:ferrous iron transport protein B